MSQKNHPQFYPHVLQNLFYSTFVEQISISFFLFLSVYQQVNTYYMPFIHLLPRDVQKYISYQEMCKSKGVLSIFRITRQACFCMKRKTAGRREEIPKLFSFSLVTACVPAIDGRRQESEKYPFQCVYSAAPIITLDILAHSYIGTFNHGCSTMVCDA